MSDGSIPPIVAEAIDNARREADLDWLVRSTIGSMRLAIESLESYQRNGDRVVDKADQDLRFLAQRCVDLRVEIARRR